MIVADGVVKEFAKVEKAPGRRFARSVKTSVRAVDGVSLTARDGETLGILGPNGAGKTTLLRILGTLMEPTSGTVRHLLPDGTRLEDPVRVKERMGYLSNNTRLYDKLTVRELLQMLGDVYGMGPLTAGARIDVCVETLGLADFLDSRIGRLSTGQTQRASIARCLFADPDLYILDEPTLGLDIMSAAAIVDFMQAEKTRGKTIVYSTHYLEEAQALCDRVLLMNRGRVVAAGSPAELCASTGKESLREAFLAVIAADDAGHPVFTKGGWRA